jgi:hypothetical protein
MSFLNSSEQATPAPSLAPVLWLPLASVNLGYRA